MSKEKELQKAIETIKKYCESQKECHKCILYGDVKGCEIYVPENWQVDYFLSEKYE